MSHKVALIIPFYGDWPSYYKLFLHSCRGNDLDVLIFTDLPATGFEPENVKVISYSLEQFKKSVSDKLHLQPAIKSSYKLCDFRPAYGLIFSEYLKEYSFWGWGDMDVVYGNLSAFINAHTLEANDVISIRKHWVSGSFSLFKNKPEVNELFKVNDDYKEVFTTERHFSFGECGKKWNELRQGTNIDCLEWTITNSTLHVLHAQKEGLLKCSFRDIAKESINSADFIKFDHGKITDSFGREFLLYHYISEKKSYKFSYPDWNEVPDVYYIDRYGFYKAKEFENLTLHHILRGLKAHPKKIKNYWKKLISKYESRYANTS